MTLPWARLLLQKINTRNFHTSRYTSLFYEPPGKDGYQQKSKDECEWEKLSLKDKWFLEMKLLKETLKESYNEYIDTVMKGPELVHPHDVNVIWRFTGDPNELNRWVITTDKDNNIGFSTAQLEFTRFSKGLFHGFLDTKLPPDGNLKNTGYCNLKLTPQFSIFEKFKYYDWSEYTHLVLRVRGDGRVYAINLHVPGQSDVTQFDTHHYFIWTRGGPYWQHVRIPFSRFLFAYKGRIQSSGQAIDKKNISSISLTISDKVTGPFRLEIDYIGIELDPSHLEESAYEDYSFDQHFW